MTITLGEVELMMILEAWDKVSAAIDRVVTAQPAQMTAAAAELEHQRKAMRAVINVATMPKAVSP